MTPTRFTVKLRGKRYLASLWSRSDRIDMRAEELPHLTAGTTPFLVSVYVIYCPPTPVRKNRVWNWIIDQKV